MLSCTSICGVAGPQHIFSTTVYHVQMTEWIARTRSYWNHIIRFIYLLLISHIRPARIVFISNGWLAHSSRCCYLGWLTIRLVNRQLKLLLCIRTICQNCNGPSSPPYHSTEGGSNCLKGCDWIVITITVVIIINSSSSSSSTAFNL